MPDETRDWSGFAMQIAVHPESGFGPKGEPLGWRVIAPGSGGTPEEAANYAQWALFRDSTPDAGAERAENTFCASHGWPLPFPEVADPLMLRPYDRQRFPAGRIITDRREAAILAPGDFPDVDTTVDPPQFYPTPNAEEVTPTVPSRSTDPALGEPVASGGDVSAPSSPARRVPKVGDRVVIEPSGRADAYIEGIVEMVVRDADGDVTQVVRVADQWGWIMGWLA